ncbi:MAG TPA: phospholipase D family protein [Solirubrobacterales bacterium]|nr:phospholipase D family protein [Solirubrobacterales bacterium]
MAGVAVFDPYERRLLLEALRPPAGYELDHAIGTTYSLDLLALLSAPLAFSPFAESDTAATDPLVLLEALRASAERITLFCEAGRIYVPPADRLLLAHLEGSVVECIAPLGGAFHPKVWLLRFVSGEEAVFRFLCLSRNLTFDRSWDTSLVLDGRVRGRTRVTNRPLVEFVRALPGMAVREPPAERLEAIGDLAAEALRVEWEVPPPFEELTFHPLGHRKRASSWPFEDARVDRMLVVAPFVSAPMLERLSADGADHVIVSRADRLDQCTAEAVDRYSDKYVLADAASDDGPGEDPAEPMQGLHAKFYIADQGWKATIWTGSANATVSAFEENVEFLVALCGSKSQVGVERVLQPAAANEVKFRDLLASYERSDEVDPELEAGRLLEREAAQLRRRLADGALQLRALPGVADGLWDLVLEATALIEPMPNLQSVEVWPVTRARQASAEAIELVDAGELARFSGLPLELLTPFIAYRVLLRSGQTEITEEFVLNLTLLGDPEDRRAHVLRSMLSNQAEVLRYLLYLLSGDRVEAVRALSQVARPPDGSAGDLGGVHGLPLLESLLRTLDRDPVKLAAVRRVVEDLQGSEGGSSLLPEGWQDIWEPVSAVAHREQP